MIDENIKAFEEQLLFAINTYLANKKFLTDGNEGKYKCAPHTASEIRLHFSDEKQKNILTYFIDCPTNARPCLSGYIDLTLKREEGVRFSKTRFYFHICTCDYKVLSTKPFKIIVENISVLFKQGNRLC